MLWGHLVILCPSTVQRRTAGSQQHSLRGATKKFRAIGHKNFARLGVRWRSFPGPFSSIAEGAGPLITSPGTIPGAVHQAAREHASFEAVVDEVGRPTFVEIERLIETYARAFVASGVEPGDRIALWAPNGLQWVLVAFAVYCVGAVLVPVNTRFKGEEASNVIGTSQARMVLTVTDFLGMDYLQMIRETDGLDGVQEVVVLSRENGNGATDVGTFLERGGSVGPDRVRAREAALGPNDVSDIIFTSGTTGRPKGVVLRHGASVETYRQWSARVGLRQNDRMLMVYPFFHTAGLKSGVLAAFLQGATLVPHSVFDVDSVLRRVTTDRISVLPGPPSVFQAILAHPSLSDFDLTTLRLCITGAASVPVQLIERIRDQLHFECIVTAYGLTETHGTVTACQSTDSAEIIATTVGAPLDGLEMRIAADDGRSLPPGDTGEVMVRGFNVTSCYLNDPDASAEAITDGWLHTGDVGYLESDGYLRLVDRKKDMVIVGGFNVAPAEVEGIILRRDDVEQVAVVAVGDDRLGEVVAAFVVAPPGQSLGPLDIQDWCRERLANYKVPRYVWLVDQLPMNASGKVQKLVLRETARRQVEGLP